MPDGAEFLCVARTLEGPQGAFPERPRRTAILSAAISPFATRSSTARRFPRSARAAVGGSLRPLLTPVGPACRLCERAGCLARAEPPVTRPLGLDEMVTGLSAFDFQ